MARDFRVFAPLSFFEKAGAPKGQRKRIAGVISTELKDKQDEVVLQRGLDFGPFIASGWFNDNHSKRTVDVLGYPSSVRPFEKGDALPDGSTAQSAGTWSEGFLLDTPEAQKVWDLGVALQQAGNDRRLGFSIEGSVQQRLGPNGKIVAKALVRNVAVTNAPVSEGTRLETLAKSLREATEEPMDKSSGPEPEMDKGLTMGTGQPGINPSADGPVTGEGAGRVLAPQSLEEKMRPTQGTTVAETVKSSQAEKDAKLASGDDDDDGDEDDKEKGEMPDMGKSMAVATIQNRLSVDRQTAERAYRVLCQLKQRGLL